MRTPPTAGSAIATQARRRRGGAAGGRGNAISVSAAGVVIRGVGRNRIRPAGLASSDAAAPAGTGDSHGARAQAEDRSGRPVPRLPVEHGLVESAAVGGTEIGHGDRPTADLDGDVPPGHVRVVEPHGHARCHARGRAGPARGARPAPHPDHRRRAAPMHSRSGRRSMPGTGPPSPSTAPCASSGDVSGRSSASRVEAAQSPRRTPPARGRAPEGRRAGVVVARGHLDVDGVPPRTSRSAGRGRGLGRAWAHRSPGQRGRPTARPWPPSPICGQRGCLWTTSARCRPDVLAFAATGTDPDRRRNP